MTRPGRGHRAPVCVVDPGPVDEDDSLLCVARDLVVELDIIDSGKRHGSLLTQVKIRPSWPARRG